MSICVANSLAKKGQNCKHNVEKAMVYIDQKIQASLFIFEDTN